MDRPGSCTPSPQLSEEAPPQYSCARASQLETDPLINLADEWFAVLKEAEQEKAEQEKAEQEKAEQEKAEQEKAEAKRIEDLLDVEEAEALMTPLPPRLRPKFPYDTVVLGMFIAKLCRYEIGVAALVEFIFNATDRRRRVETALEKLYPIGCCWNAKRYFQDRVQNVDILLQMPLPAWTASNPYPNPEIVRQFKRDNATGNSWGELDYRTKRKHIVAWKLLYADINQSTR
jgi:hypothetical protein